METIEQISRKYDTDKAAHTHYLRNYAELFKNLSGKEVKLLELGIFHGGSLLLWRDYFQKRQIAGLDINPVQIKDAGGRIHIYQGKQEDTQLLNKIAAEVAPEGFDIIIDDCAHIGSLSRISFWHLFENHLKSGGFYVIEDWGTGYWDTWTDGVKYSGYRIPTKVSFSEKVAYKLSHFSRKMSLPIINSLISRLKRFLLKRNSYSHNIGMVGFIKELIDECGMGDVYHSQFGADGNRTSKIREMRISHGHVFVIKN